MEDKETTSHYSVVMPRLGLTMTEARITEWLKQEGAWVEKGAPLFILEHEKASLEIESPASGRLHILVPVDQVVPILTPIAILAAGEEGHNLEPAPTVLSHSQTSFPRNDNPSPQVNLAREEGEKARLRATPKARSLARNKGISLSGVAGSGPRGMVVCADLPIAAPTKVMNASPVARKVAQEMGVDLSEVSGSGPHGKVMRRDVERASQPALGMHGHPLAKLSGLRGIIASRLSASWMERPQVTLTTDADATCLVTLRQQIMDEWNVKISFNALLVKLVAQALREHPNLNVQLTPDGIIPQREINIGLAVDTERGLMVPVLHQAENLSLFEIHEAVQGLTQRAIEGCSLPDELSGGTFTITNLGMYEIDAFTPIINPPECAILGVGRIISRPVGVNGQVVLREMMALSLSFDHRLVDGAPAARFLQRIKTLIEHCFLIGISR